MMTCSSRQFAAFRIVLGLFLVSHFLWLMPFSGELYGPAGMVPPSFQTPFPNILSLVRDDGDVRAIVAGLAILGVLLLVGFHRRWAAFLLWYGWACLTNRVPFLYVPSEGLVGWLLLFCALVPGGERWAIRPGPKKSWTVPAEMMLSVWIVLGVGYFASGVDKLSSPSWQEGTAIRSVLTSPIARWDFIAEGVRSLPDPIIRGMSWSVLAVEVSFFALIWHRWTRPIAWFAATTIHLGIRMMLDLHTVTDPFLIAQLLLFDPTWFDRSSSSPDRREQERPVSLPVSTIGSIAAKSNITEDDQNCRSRRGRRPLRAGFPTR